MGGIPGIDAVKFVQQKEKLEREEAASKKKYRILAGHAFLDDDKRAGRKYKSPRGR